MIGATEDVNDAFAKDTAASYGNAKANLAAADASSELLKEYEDLTREGVEPTEESKRRLQEITLLLTIILEIQWLRSIKRREP